MEARQPKDSYPLRIKIWVNNQANRSGQFNRGWVKGNSRMDGDARWWWKSIMAIEPVASLETMIPFTDPPAFSLLRDITGYHLEIDTKAHWPYTSFLEEVRKYCAQLSLSSAIHGLYQTLLSCYFGSFGLICLWELYQVFHIYACALNNVKQYLSHVSATYFLLSALAFLMRLSQQAPRELCRGLMQSWPRNLGELMSHRTNM